MPKKPPCHGHGAGTDICPEVLLVHMHAVEYCTCWVQNHFVSSQHSVIKQIEVSEAGQEVNGVSFT